MVTNYDTINSYTLLQRWHIRYRKPIRPEHRAGGTGHPAPASRWAINSLFYADRNRLSILRFIYPIGPRFKSIFLTGYWHIMSKDFHNISPTERTVNATLNLPATKIINKRSLRSEPSQIESSGVSGKKKNDRAALHFPLVYSIFETLRWVMRTPKAINPLARAALARCDHSRMGSVFTVGLIY